MKPLPGIEMTVELSQKTLEYLKEEEGLTQKEITALLGTTPSYLSQVKAGKKVLQKKHLDNLQKQKPDIYLHILVTIVGDKLDTGMEFIKEKTMDLKATGQKGIKSLKGVTADVALAVCKLMTR